MTTFKFRQTGFDRNYCHLQLIEQNEAKRETSTSNSLYINQLKVRVGSVKTKFCGFVYYHYHYHSHSHSHSHSHYCYCCCYFLSFVLIIWKRVPIVWNSVGNLSPFVWRKILVHMAHPLNKFKGVKPPTPYREEKVLPPDPNIFSDL